MIKIQLLIGFLLWCDPPGKIQNAFIYPKFGSWTVKSACQGVAPLKAVKMFNFLLCQNQTRPITYCFHPASHLRSLILLSVLAKHLLHHHLKPNSSQFLLFSLSHLYIALYGYFPSHLTAHSCRLDCILQQHRFSKMTGVGHFLK